MHYEWREDDDKIYPVAITDGGREVSVAWAPQPGSQEAFLSCYDYEVLYEGTRGPGKTDALLMDFAQDVGKGYGVEWRGILFRQTYKQLEDLIAKALKWFPNIFPDAKWNGSDKVWTFADGESLRLRYMERPTDYYNYHGHAYPWIGWEELTTWPDDQCFRLMMSCSRSTQAGMPRKVRSTTNPYGIGHNWVKTRYRLPIPPQHIIGPLIKDSKDEDGNLEPPRRAIHGELVENQILLKADPDYPSKIIAAARNPSEKRAWLFGDWNVVAGGMFDDIWFEAKERIVIAPFTIPETWIIDRSFDWGSSKPFSVGWWAESDGTDYQDASGKWRSSVRGDLFRIGEWYGWTGTANTGCKMNATEIAKGIRKREQAMGIADRVIPGVADSSIFDEENDNCIATDMEAEGIEWHPADKRPGSRAQGWELMRKMLKATVPQKGPREDRGLFVFTTCEHFLRTVPTIPRDEKKIDDVDTDSEDHVADEARYRARFERPTATGGTVKGLF